MTDIERQGFYRARSLIRDFGPSMGTVWRDSKSGNAVQVITCAVVVDTFVPVVVFSDFDQAWCLDLDEWTSEIPGPDLSPVRRFVPVEDSHHAQTDPA